LLPASDPRRPRLHFTIDAVVAGLYGEHVLLDRYRHDDGPAADEGTFDQVRGLAAVRASCRLIQTVVFAAAGGSRLGAAARNCFASV
jgi:hypothetical protein